MVPRAPSQSRRRERVHRNRPLPVFSYSVPAQAECVTAFGLEHAGYAALNLGALKSHLTQTDVVDGLDALTPA